MKKARLATNQANARAAYACATTQYMLDTANTAATTDTSYTYDTSTGKLRDTAATTGTKINKGTDISSWGIDDDNLGTKTFKSWTVVLDSTGTVTEYKAIE